MAEVQRRAGLNRGRAIGDPDTFAVEIDQSWLRLRNGVFRKGPGKQWPLQDRHRQLAGRIWNRDREDTCILVIDACELDALLGAECRQTQPLPREQIK
jgi:hypothetical protein